MRIVKNIQIAGLVFLLFSLTGCVSNPSLRAIDPARNIPISDLNHWQFKARVAIKTPEESVTASLEWQKDQSLFDFLLSGSFGVTIAHLTQQDDVATLKIPDTDKLVDRDAGQLLNQTLGWEFPINELSYWIKGLPSGRSGEQINYNDKGQISSIALDEWQIHFSKYRLYQGYSLPKMIKATHPDISLKVVAKKWLFLQ